MSLLLQQSSFPDFCLVTAAVDALADVDDAGSRGAVFTRAEVVHFILDLMSYTSDRPLWRVRLLEPSFGNGDFLMPAVDRLLTAWAAQGDVSQPLQMLGDCIRAVELHRSTFQRTRSKLWERLVAAGIAAQAAEALANRWLLQGDYLLTELPDGFDAVVGNPPYVRQELIPEVLLSEYRNRYTTMFDRADLYIPFIERSLRLLKPQGALGFICADRWMKNRYGGPLRALVAEHFNLKVHVDMTDTDAFQSDVAAYPAITVITREAQGVTRVVSRPTISAESLRALATQLTAPPPVVTTGGVSEINGVSAGAEPWVLDGAETLALVRRLERALPTIEEAGCKVGIGVATGADRAYIGPFDALDVEFHCKLPLVTTRDLVDGRIEWRGLGVINPFEPDGGLVDLAAHPRLGRHLEKHRQAIANRHCVRKSPARWYRTIDRITASLVATPKLLVPDIKGDAQIVFDEGKFYPHHNLYFITANEWDLRALQAVLLSGIARLFVATYSTRMRGGFLRFQAQYLRRIRVPHWRDVSDALRLELINAASTHDLVACNRAACELYGLSSYEQTLMKGEP